MCRERKLSQIDNGIDCQQYPRTLNREQAKRRLGYSSEDFLVGGVGRLSTEKAFDVLIAAVQCLAADYPQMHLVIAGEGPDRPRLEHLIRRAKFPGRVRLLGYHENPLEVFQALDVFVLSSLREGLPNALMEAMALEAPVVATRVGGIRKAD